MKMAASLTRALILTKETLTRCIFNLPIGSNLTLSIGGRCDIRDLQAGVRNIVVEYVNH